MKNPCIREALLYEKINKKVKCETCERFCLITKGKLGFCKTRKNIHGKLFTLEYGDIGNFIEANPIEKKPFFHFWPGSYALTAGTWSCNFTCPWCQNWHMSKSPPNPEKANFVSPEEFVELVKKENCQGTSISFNEPTLLFEYSLDVFSLARKKDYYNTFVTNGYMTLKALKLLVEAGLDAMNVDVKGDKEAVKKFCGADVEKVWRNIVHAKKFGIHVEVTTLIIPGVNDDEECLRSIAKRIFEIDPSIPWHTTAYYPAYKFTTPPTPIEALEKAWKIGKEEGIKFVYSGNVPGHPYENTYCPSCNELLIQRFGFDILSNKITKDKKCPKCKESIQIVGLSLSFNFSKFRS